MKKYIILLFSLMLLNSCMVISSLQRAKHLNPDENEHSLAFNSVYNKGKDLDANNEDICIGNQFSYRWNTGINEYLNFSSTGMIIHSKNLNTNTEDELVGSFAMGYLEAGPRFKILDDNISFYLAFSSYLFLMNEIRPTLFISKEIKPGLEINSSMTYIKCLGRHFDDINVSKENTVGAAFGLSYNIYENITIMPNLSARFQINSKTTFVGFGVNLIIN